MAEEIIGLSAVEASSVGVSPEKPASPEELIEGRIEFRESGHERAAAKYEKILSKVVVPKSASASDDDAAADARDLSDMSDEEGKVKKLIDLAQTKSVEHAVRVARSLGNYYVLDRMHDELAGRLYDELMEHGLIGKE